MIQPSELRLGNWVDAGVYVRVLAIYPDSISTLGRENITDFYPIPLTPGVLEKFGFKCTSKGFWVHDQWYNLSLKKRNMTYDLRYDFMGTVATNIDYLHHIQNIFFCLCGEELNFKP